MYELRNVRFRLLVKDLVFGSQFEWSTGKPIKEDDRIICERLLRLFGPKA